MAKQRIEIEVDVPEGWVVTGEYRHVQPNDHYMPEPSSAACWVADDPTDDAYLILRRVEPVRASRWAIIHKSPGYWVVGSFFDAPDIPRSESKQHGLRYARIDFENDTVAHVALEPADGEG